MIERSQSEQFNKLKILQLLKVCAVDVVKGHLQKSNQYSDEVKSLYLTHANNLQTLLNSILETKDLGKWSKEFLSPFAINPILIIANDNITRLVELGEIPYPKTPEELIVFLENRIKLEKGVKLEENQNLISLIIHLTPLSSQVLSELQSVAKSNKRLVPIPYEIKQKCLEALKVETDNTDINEQVVGEKVSLFINANVFTPEEWESYLFTHK